MEDLLSKGLNFQSTSSFLKAEFFSEKGRRKLKLILDSTLKPSHFFDEKTAELMTWLIAGGLQPEEYFRILKTYDNSPVCGLVWNANFFAYRCRDCGISPCMSLCADCFLAGNHEGHDFNMFKSQAGGACDCGDETVMKKEGYCHQHDKKENQRRSSVPSDLLLLPEVILPKLVTSLYERIDSILSTENELDVLVNGLKNVNLLLNILNEFSEIEVLREIICSKIMSPIEHVHHHSPVAGTSSEVSGLMSCEASNGRKIIRSASTEKGIERTVVSAVSYVEGPHKPFLEDTDQVSQSSVMKEGMKKTYVHYFMDVLVKTEFPSKLATFLLQLLPNQLYKELFTRLFCRQYTAVGKLLSSSLNPDLLSNHMVHVSVQLFSNENLALKMVKEENLLFKMIFVLSKMIGECLETYPLEIEGHETSIMAVNCDNQILSGHCYWPIASDLTNILSHQSVAKIFLETGDCLNRWMHFVNMLTGMNINNRRLITHIEYEPRTYYSAFSIEFESVAAVMWEIYRAINKMNDKVHVLKMIEVSAAAIKDWYSFVPKKLDKSSFTFHLPLHRYFALFVSQAVNHFGEDIRKILPTNIILYALDHLLNAVVSVQEIRAGLWTYNGHQIRCQAQSYLQSYFCNSMFDLDLFFLQIIASVMDEDAFIDMLLNRFCIRTWFQFGDEIEISDDNNKVLSLVEGCLSLLLMLLMHRVYSGESEESVLRKDITTSLCVADRTHSQLVDVIPTRPGYTHSPGKDFEKVLAEVALYKSPAVEVTAMQQGIYTPKDEVWVNEYDYNHVQLRVYKKSDNQIAQERYNAVMVKNKLSASSSPWPPLRSLTNINPAFKDVFRLLQSKTLHKMLIFIIHKSVENINAIPEGVIILTIHLLQLALDEKPSTNLIVSMKKTFDDDDEIIQLALDYLDSLHDKEKSLKLSENILQKLKKDADMAFKMENYNIDVDITFLVQEKFHDALFKGLCSYIESALSQGALSLSQMVKHVKNLLFQISDRKYHLLKRLIQFWNYYCRKNAIDYKELPFIRKATDQKIFLFVISMLLKNYDYLFEVHTPLLGFPESAFDIQLLHSCIGENAHVVFNSVNTSGVMRRTSSSYFSEEMMDESTIDQFIDVVKCNRERAVSYLNKCDGDLQTALTLCLNQFPVGAEENIQDVNMEPTCSKNTELSATCELCSGMRQKYTKNDCSLLTMLVKLRNILLERSVTSPTTMKGAKANMIAGDGVFYIDKLLKNFSSYSEKNSMVLGKICPNIIPEYNKDVIMKGDTKNDSLQDKAKQERKLKAKERQKLLLAEFALKQKKFIDNIGSSSSMDISESGINPSLECVICGQQEESSEEKPIGLIVLFQPSTVLAKRQTTTYTASTSSDTKDATFCDDVLANRVKALAANFDSRSSYSAFECGLDCGINIQTCGHCVHVDCQQSYFKSLQEDHQRLINTDKGEFSCPFCRQFSNGVLPMLPPNLRKSNEKDLKKLPTYIQNCDEISKFLSHFQQGGLSQFTARALEFTVLTASMTTIAHTMKELLTSSNKRFIKFCEGNEWKWSDKFFILLASLRNNIEIEAMNIVEAPQISTKSCIGALLEAFHFHSQYVSSSMRFRWNELCYGEDREEETENLRKGRSSLNHNEVPLLLVDSISLLLQFFLTWPKRMTQAHLHCTIQLLYNLTYIQALCVIGSNMQTEEKESWHKQTEKNDRSSAMCRIASLVWKYTTSFQTNTSQQIEITQLVVSPHTIETQLQEMCLPFLKISYVLSSAWLQDAAYDVQIFKTSSPFQSLANFLQLGGEHMAKSSDRCSTDYLLWSHDDPCEIIKHWFTSLNITVSKFASVKFFLPVFVSWQQPKLITLPPLFDSLFQIYRKRKCKRCKQIPSDPTICLVCGDFMCFHGSCCTNENSINECVQHSIDCGCGTGVFLVVSSSVTLVVRDERVCLWGSVYLDKHGEEDRDLKRGKPLFLSKERYSRLEAEWKTHTLDRSSKRWGLHLNRL